MLNPPDGDSGKVALVIGGTKGMGHATTIALARDGFRVVACSRSQGDVDALLAEAGAMGLPIVGSVCDAACEEDLDAFIDGAAERFGRIDALVFAAGKAFAGNALTLTAGQWDECFRINLRAPFLAARRVIPIMAAQGGGSLVFISTIWAFTTPRDRVAYLTAKSGLPALVRGLAIDHGENGIRCNAVAPGYVDTGFLKESIAAVHGWQHVDDAIEDVLKAHPLGRMVKPEEVAEAICFLAGDRSSGFTGQTLTIDGGAATRFSLADAWRRE
jgi:NAD(P)-dependent dehydrogenase (short-subunit alcohol dehydrogenase family)